MRCPGSGRCRSRMTPRANEPRTRLLQAAKKYRIVPVGFIANELEVAQRSTAAPAVLPSGFVTMLMTDIEGSTALVEQLGARFGALIDGVWEALRTAVADAQGFEVEARADEFFAVFEAPRAAIEAAVAMQRAFAERSFVDDTPVLVRVGVHSGYPTSTAGNYVGARRQRRRRGSRRSVMAVRSSCRRTREKRCARPRDQPCDSWRWESTGCVASHNRCRCSRWRRRVSRLASRRSGVEYRRRSPTPSDTVGGRCLVGRFGLWMTNGCGSSPAPGAAWASCFTKAALAAGDAVVATGRRPEPCPMLSASADRSARGEA